MADLTQEQVVEYLSGMTVMQLVELTKDLEEKWGVKAAPVAVAGGGGGAVAAAAPAEEQTEFDVMMTGFGDKKLNVVKLVKTLTGATLMESKKMVESAPVAIKEKVSKEEAEKVKAELEEAGASVELK